MFSKQTIEQIMNIALVWCTTVHYSELFNSLLIHNRTVEQKSAEIKSVCFSLSSKRNAIIKVVST